jgi:uncharacterized protein (TIGR02466 family)
MDSQFITFPVFSSVISATKIDDDLTSFTNDIKNLSFSETNQNDSYKSFSTEDLHIFDHFPEIEKLILSYFYEFKNSVLKLTTTDFEITTSWATKTTTDGYCQFHSHRNSYYSGVLYFDKYTDGHILFDNSTLKNNTFMVNEPSEWNIYNYQSFVIQPDKNLLVFFPSDLKHKINVYTGLKDRYSVAFNLIPVGTIGLGDSSVTISQTRKRN